VADGTRAKGAATLRLEASPYVSEAVETLVDLMRGSRQDAVRLAAAKEIFDRVGGKPTAPAEVDISVLLQRKLSELSSEELKELGQRYRDAVGSAPLQIEADVEND